MGLFGALFYDLLCQPPLIFKTVNCETVNEAQLMQFTSGLSPPVYFEVFQVEF